MDKLSIAIKRLSTFRTFRNFFYAFSSENFRMRKRLNDEGEREGKRQRENIDMKRRPGRSAGVDRIRDDASWDFNVLNFDVPL